MNMELTVLVDNNTSGSKCLLAEHGLSFYIEDCDVRLLFDCGSSDAFIKNAYNMQLELDKITDIVLSHAHVDHVGGLLRLQSLYKKFEHVGIDFPAKNIIAHPDVFKPSESNILDNEAKTLTKEDMDKFFNLVLTRRPFPITPKLMYIGEIPVPKDVTLDYTPDESAVAYKSNSGLVIISGCSHSGIDNIIKHAKYITGEDRILTVIGGLYLINKSEEYINYLGQFLRDEHVRSIYPCHCTDLEAKIILSKYVKIEDVCTGKSYRWD